jgi:hypothetical protein
MEVGCWEPKKQNKSGGEQAGLETQQQRLLDLRPAQTSQEFTG